MYIDCCKIQILIQFLNIFNTYKTNVNVDNGYIYYAIIKCTFYEFKNNFKTIHLFKLDHSSSLVKFKNLIHTFLILFSLSI